MIFHYEAFGEVYDDVLDCDDNEGLGTIGKNVRNRLPNYSELFYLHKEKTNETMKHDKA